MSSKAGYKMLMKLTPTLFHSLCVLRVGVRVCIGVNDKEREKERERERERVFCIRLVCMIFQRGQKMEHKRTKEIETNLKQKNN